jgi:hypothetical protein
LIFSDNNNKLILGCIPRAFDFSTGAAYALQLRGYSAIDEETRSDVDPELLEEQFEVRTPHYKTMLPSVRLAWRSVRGVMAQLGFPTFRVSGVRLFEKWNMLLLPRIGECESESELVAVLEKNAADREAAERAVVNLYNAEDFEAAVKALVRLQYITKLRAEILEKSQQEGWDLHHAK